jgi:hypothetical protein
MGICNGLSIFMFNKTGIYQLRSAWIHPEASISVKRLNGARFINARGINSSTKRKLNMPGIGQVWNACSGTICLWTNKHHILLHMYVYVPFSFRNNWQFLLYDVNLIFWINCFFWLRACCRFWQVTWRGQRYFSGNIGRQKLNGQIVWNLISQCLFVTCFRNGAETYQLHRKLTSKTLRGVCSMCFVSLWLGNICYYSPCLVWTFCKLFVSSATLKGISCEENGH